MAENKAPCVSTQMPFAGQKEPEVQERPEECLMAGYRFVVSMLD